MENTNAPNQSAVKRALLHITCLPVRLVAGYKRYLGHIAVGWKARWKQYLIQSFAATFIVFIIFLTITPERPVIVASIGASTFIVFALPRSHSAQPSRVVGGHIIGILSGSLFAFIPQMAMLPAIMIYSIAVGLSIFLMVSLNLEHPPASGTALGIALNGFTPQIATAVILSTLALAIAHIFVCRKFQDLA